MKFPEFPQTNTVKSFQAFVAPLVSPKPAQCPPSRPQPLPCIKTNAVIMWHFVVNVFIPTRSFSNKPALGPQANLISVKRKKSNWCVSEANMGAVIKCWETVTLMQAPMPKGASLIRLEWILCMAHFCIKALNEHFAACRWKMCFNYCRSKMTLFYALFNRRWSFNRSR